MTADPITLAAAVIGGYLLGAVPFGLVLCLLTGKGDIRKVGSGNIGATNVLRAGSRPLAALTLVLDAGKGAIAALVARDPSMDDLEIAGRRVSTTNTAVQLDFGGFAKGVALDRAVDILRDHGIRHAIVNAGGDLNTLGRAAGRPWRVAVRHPEEWGVLASLEPRDGEVVYTSGNYQRFREDKGIRYGHIIDPRDGMPVRDIVSATVLGRDGALADAAATALSVAGPGDWRDVAKAMGVDRALLVESDGTLHMTDAMRERIILADEG